VIGGYASFSSSTSEHPFRGFPDFSSSAVTTMLICYKWMILSVTIASEDGS
jgi:hypothetical protein